MAELYLLPLPSFPVPRALSSHAMEPRDSAVTCQQGPVAPSWRDFSWILLCYWLTCGYCLASSHPYAPTVAPRGQSRLPRGLCDLSSLSLPYKRMGASGTPSSWWQLTNPHQSWEGCVYIWKGLSLLLEDQYRHDHKMSIFTPKKCCKKGFRFLFANYEDIYFYLYIQSSEILQQKACYFTARKLIFLPCGTYFSLWQFLNTEMWNRGSLDLVKFHRTEKVYIS